MNLECLNGIITNNLAINIDITNINSWNLNSELILISLNKWNKTITDDIILTDYGLTAFDNGGTNNLSNSLTLTQNDNKLKLRRIGYNNNSGGTYYDSYNILPVTGSSVGRYFSLNGGYLQGFFKLDGYNYEIFPPRYNNGITVETLIEILPQTSGIFYYMGTRAEDKFNPYYSGETMILSATSVQYGGKYTGNSYYFSGITTSKNNYLVSFEDEEEVLSSFQQPEDSKVIISNSVEQLLNIGNNIISFEITEDRKLKYKYVDTNGNLVQNESPNEIYRIGWTLISIVYKPYDIINNYDSKYYSCYSRRKGDLIFYINGSKFWKIENFDEFYFTSIKNNSEKQIGVPYNISWGGGSFGLKHSWHYENFNKSSIIQDERKNNLFVERYFNSAFIGNLQKLRVYDKALSSAEILHNATIEAKSNVNYGMFMSNGGRIIRRYENVTYVPQQVSGSDIRKSIRYRNSDGTYKSLYNMIDIYVVIKSKSRPNIELIKFKKTAEYGWLSLIYMNDTTYDFIVPDTITSQHANEILFAEIKFQWADPYDIDNVFDKIFIVDITSSQLLNNTVKNY